MFPAIFTTRLLFARADDTDPSNGKTDEKIFGIFSLSCVSIFRDELKLSSSVIIVKNHATKRG